MAVVPCLQSINCPASDPDKSGINGCSRANQHNEESCLCSLSAITRLQPKVAIYKQVSDHTSKCMSLFCGFHLRVCVRSEAVSVPRLCLSSRVLLEFLWTATYDFMKHLNSSN